MSDQNNKPTNPSDPDFGANAGTPASGEPSTPQGDSASGSSPANPYSSPGQPGGFQPYPSVNHPEDSPGFEAREGFPPYPNAPQQPGNPYGGVGGTSESNDPYGNAGGNYYQGSGTAGFTNSYGQYGADYHSAGAQFVPGQVHPRLRWPYRQGNDTFDIGEAFTFGIKSVFFDPLIWILGSFVFTVLTFGTSYAGSNETLYAIASLLNIATMIATVLITPIVYHFALRSLNGYRLELSTLREGLNYGSTLGVVIVSNIISVLAALPGLIGLILVAFANYGDFMAEEVSSGAILSMGLFILLSVAGSVIVYPFILLAPFYAADGMGFGAAFKAAFNDGKRRYWLILGFSIILGLAMTFVILLTCGLATLIALPAYYLALAYAYRSLSGRIYPTQQKV